jgi:hypothetical protein
MSDGMKALFKTVDNMEAPPTPIEEVSVTIEGDDVLWLLYVLWMSEDGKTNVRDKGGLLFGKVCDALMASGADRLLERIREYARVRNLKVPRI